MNNRTVKPVVLVFIFIGALILFSFLTNKVNTDSTTKMDEASLPVMQFVYKDATINELHGYTREMDILSMRDGLVPMDKNRSLNLKVLTYGNKVENLAYEIRSLDGSRLLLEEDSAEIVPSQDKIEHTIQLPSLFEENVEYNMQIVLTVDGQEVYYYTRVVQSVGCYVDEMLDFAYTFHDYTFRDDAGSFIPTYMDPATGDATKLSYVDLSCTLRQITWADFGGMKLAEPVASFKEITPSYNVIVLNYVVTNINEKNEVEYYNVEEYYRLRQTPTRIYVLNFERTMNQIFRSENDFLVGDSTLLLGIRNDDVEYLANEAGDCIAFVQEGELWVYDRVNNAISQVFSFRGIEGIDDRENWDQHEIKIVRVDEAGSISFVVCGYMNRGIHEGEVGVGIYYYDAIGHTVEEEAFIPSDKSYEVLQAELGELTYVNEQKLLYLMMEQNVYKIDLTTFDVDTMIESETESCYAVSESGRYLAWIDDEDMYSSTSISLIDLKTGIQHEITSEENTYLRPLAFIGDDFVYGVANSANVKTDAVGNLVFPMSRIEILNTSDEKQDIIKVYEPTVGLIGDVVVDANNVYLDVIVEQNGRFIYSGADTIMNRETEPANEVALTTTVTEIKQTQVAITMKEVTAKANVKIVTPKMVLVDEDRSVSLEETGKNYYYAYVKGEIVLATTDVSDAVRVANENNGVVVDSNMKYIFKRARSTTQPTLKNLSVNEADVSASSVAKCVSIILTREGFGISVNELIEAGHTPANVLRNTLTNVSVLELRNCTMDELLYFVDQGTPVFARVQNGQAILLTGYSASTVYYYDTSSGQTKGVSYDTIETMFYNGGNYFIAYVK